MPEVEPEVRCEEFIKYDLLTIILFCICLYSGWTISVSYCRPQMSVGLEEKSPPSPSKLVLTDFNEKN